MPDAPAIPRPAATVMVLRPTAEGFEVFMVRRHQASTFAADVYVFPGGTVRPDDAIAADEARLLGLEPDTLRDVLAAHDDPFAAREDGGLALWIAALRELFEEAGVLLAEEADGGGAVQLVDLSDPGRVARFETLRNELQEGRSSLSGLARQEGLRLAADRLVYFSRWITPPSSPRRFDTRFLVAEVPAGQTAGHCQIETTDGLWLSPAEALARHRRDELPMMFVTSEHVRRLAEFRTARALLDFTRGKLTQAVRPLLDDRHGPYLTPEQRHSW